ncbi:MAG: methylenetetrahydrofolate reductase, partial [Ruminococcus sp.]
MNIRDKFSDNKSILSFEVFPPKKTSPIEKIYSTLDELKTLNPAYISVTYGAGGTVADNTCAIASKIKNELNIEP